MKLFYYTSQNAAAWMAETFGMKIALRDDHAPDKLVLGEDGQVVNYAQEIMDCKRDGWCDKFYVHPDSLHLLEPQYGDIITLNEIQSDYNGYDYKPDILYRTYEDGLYGTDSYCCTKDVQQERSMKILRRDFKSFHWPESEVV